MKLFNTLTQSLQDFAPIDDTVRIYVCGVTPYDTTHLGHAFTYVTFDTLIRYLEYRGYKVRYVQNVTDIPYDYIIRKSRELGMAWDELANLRNRAFPERYGCAECAPTGCLCTSYGGDWTDNRADQDAAGAWFCLCERGLRLLRCAEGSALGNAG